MADPGSLSLVHTLRMLFLRSVIDTRTANGSGPLVLSQLFPHYRR